MAIKRETSSPPPYPGIPRFVVSAEHREPQDVPRSSSPTPYPGIPRMSPHNQNQGEAASIQECHAKDPDVCCSEQFSSKVEAPADLSKRTRRRTASTSYDAEKAPSQINLTRGEVVEEVSPDHNGWTVVRNNQGEEGAVPTRLIVDEGKSSLQKCNSYNAMGQVNLKQGEELEEVATDNDEWREVRNVNGEEGVAPAEILQIMSPNMTTKKKLTATGSYDGNRLISVQILNEPVTHLDEGYLSCGSEGRPESTGETSSLMQDAKTQRHMTKNSEKNIIDGISSRISNSKQDDVEAEHPAKSLLGSKPTTGCLVSMLALTICFIAICTLSVLYLQKQEPKVKSTITLQVGGLGRKLSKEIMELHRPLTPECKDDHIQISDLPISLRAHMAIELDGLGVLVCGGITEVIGPMSGKMCYIFKNDTGQWQEFFPLIEGRRNAFIKKVGRHVHIVGGSSSDPSNPCLKSGEILDLDTNTGWQKYETEDTSQDNLCSKLTQVIVEVACKVN